MCTEVAVAMRRHSLVVVAVFLSVLGGVSAAFAKPIIMSPEPAFDFGEAENDQKITHEFVVKNAGDEPLELTEVKTTCGCTVAELQTHLLEPGQETIVGVTFNLKGKQGPQHKRITVLSNDPDQPSYGLELTGTALTTIMVEPSIINFGRIEDAEPHEQKIIIKSMREGHTFNILDVTASEDSPFKAALETVSPGKEYTVAAVSNPNLMPGTLSGRITVRTDDESRPAILVQVYGHVIGALQVRPDAINIQANTTPEARPASMYLQVLPGRVHEFELLEVIAPVAAMKAELIKRKDNDYHIKLSDMPVDETLKDKELIVRTNLPEMPEIRIPFRVRPERPAQLGRPAARIPAGRALPGAAPPQLPRPTRPTVSPQPANSSAQQQ